MSEFRLCLQADGKLGLPPVTAEDRKELCALAARVLGIPTNTDVTDENMMPSINFSKLNLVR